MSPPAREGHFSSNRMVPDKLGHWPTGRHGRDPREKDVPNRPSARHFGNGRAEWWRAEKKVSEGAPLGGGPDL